MALSEIKVSVNGAEDKKINNQKNASPAPKKITKSKTVKKKTANTVAATKRPVSNSAPKAKGHKSGLARLITASFVTALIFGGGIYIWQQSVNEKTVDKISGEAQEAKLSFEDRIENLKRKLTGTETENIELKQKTEELEARMALLNKAKIDYENEDLAIGFTYPAIFGEINAETTEHGSSTKLIGRWEDNEKLVFGSAGDEFEIAGTSTMPELTELQGFIEKRRDYFLLGPGGAEYEVNPAKIIETKNGDAILIDNKSFVLDEGEEVPVNIGQNAAIIVNLDNDEYSGLAFINSDFGMLPLESFVQMIETFKIVK